MAGPPTSSTNCQSGERHTVKLELWIGTAAVASALLLWVLLWTALTHYRFHSYHRKAGRSYPPLGLAGWLNFYWRTTVSVVLMCWWTLRALFSDGLRYPAGRRSGRPVLCVHGFHMTGGSMWGLRRTLEECGRPTRAVFLGIPPTSTDTYARSLEKVMRSLLEELPGEGLDVVAHSMGGLVLRLVLARQSDLAARVGKVVTLGTPHHGTAILRWVRRGPAHTMMSRDAPFLRSLPEFEQSAPETVVTTVATAHDLIVYPVETAHLRSARQITLEGVAHLGLLTNRGVRDLVAEVLGGGPESGRKDGRRQ